MALLLCMCWLVQVGRTLSSSRITTFKKTQCQTGEHSEKGKKNGNRFGKNFRWEMVESIDIL